MRCLDFRNLDYCGEFDGIWASASLLHLRSAETNGVLRKTAAALKNGGVLYASWKYGSGEKYRDERFYSDYTENDIPALLEGTKLTLREYWISEDVRADRANELWLNLICVKAEA